MQPDNLWVWSPPRMGSTSVAAALEILGYDVVHYCPLTHTNTYREAKKSLYDKTIVSTGLWFGQHLTQTIKIDGALPVKTIILEREWNEWRASLDNFVVRREEIQEYQALYVNLYFWKCPQISYFDVLTGWEGLCTITGKPRPDVEFPRLNKSPQNWSI